MSHQTPKDHKQLKSATMKPTSKVAKDKQRKSPTSKATTSSSAKKDSKSPGTHEKKPEQKLKHETPSGTHAATATAMHPKKHPGLFGKLITTAITTKDKKHSPTKSEKTVRSDPLATTSKKIPNVPDPHIKPDPEKKDKQARSVDKKSPPDSEEIVIDGPSSGTSSSKKVPSSPDLHRKSEPKPFLLPQPIMSSAPRQQSIRPWADQLPQQQPKSNAERNCIIMAHVGLVLSIIFFLVLAIAPGKMQMRHREPLKTERIVKQGNLVVYPAIFLNPAGNPVLNDSYVIDLSDKSAREKAVANLKEVTKVYPTTHDEKYTDCYLNDRSSDKPCFFHKSWIPCNDTDDFGYRKVGDSYNPCLLFKIVDKTGNWKLRPQAKKYIPEDVSLHYDDNCALLKCYPVGQPEKDSFTSLEVKPKKGFPGDFFPVSFFKTSLYLSPAVSVRVKGIKESRNVSIECGLLAQDTLLFWNNGIVRIHFIFRS